MSESITHLTKSELLLKCESLGITKCKSKTKAELIQRILACSIVKPILIKPNQKKSIKKESDVNKPIFTFIDLFCGIGGFHQALANMNGKCVFACDIDANCRETYERNYGIKPASDITTIPLDDIQPFDVLCAGFPCQPFSKAGYQKGFNDDRGNLFFSICDIIEKHMPKYILLENVRNLSSHDGGNTWRVIYESIDKLGYHTYAQPIILNALHFNVPQNRERVIIMCKRKDLGELPSSPTIPKNPKTLLTRYISDIVCDEPETKNYRIDGKLLAVESVWNAFMKLFIKHKLEIPKFPLWTDWWDNADTDYDKAFYKKYKLWIDNNRQFYTDHQRIFEKWLLLSRKNPNWVGAVRKFEWQAGDLLPSDSMNTVLWSSRGSGIRVKRCDYIPTLVAMAMTPIYGPESRKLCPRELLRLQSFPDTFVYNEKKIHKQVGNSVNVTMIERCARFLIFNESLFINNSTL